MNPHAIRASALFGLLLVTGLAATQQAVPTAAAATGPGAVSATTGAPQPEGLWLSTPYPDISVPLSGDISLDVALSNSGLPPQRVAFDVSGLPDGWSWTLQGDGRPVGAAIAGPDETIDLSLVLTPPEDIAPSKVDLVLTGRAEDDTLRLPVSLSLTDVEPARLTLTPQLPALRGTVRSTFDFQVKVANEGQEDTVVNLLSQGAPGFEVTFKERYGSNELTSLPLTAGQSKDITVSVKPASDAPAGQYPVRIAVAAEDVSAESTLMLDITGRPDLQLSGPEGRLSGEATAGEESTFPFTVTNNGTAPAEQIKLSASPPQGWNISFSPAEIAALDPGQSAEVEVAMTPSDKAIAGDYVVTVRSNGDGASDSASFRVTVSTSTVWGIVGLGIIAAAVVVLALAVTRYGRR